MEGLYKNKNKIDKYLVRDLSNPELEKIHDMLTSDPELSSLIENREIELIENYLNGKLDENLLGKFEKRIKSDKKFENDIAFSKNLRIASKDIKRRTELKNQLKEIKQKIDKEKEIGTYKPITSKKSR